MICRRCQTETGYKWARVCSPCARKAMLRSRFMSGAELARSEVAKARRRGELPPPHECACVDCGVVAHDYDHRDYNRPLMVAAVCRGCNLRRGSAIPKRWAPGEWEAYTAATRFKHRRVGSLTRFAKLLDEFAPEVPRLLDSLSPEARGDRRQRKFGHMPAAA